MENKVTADYLDEEGCLHCGICGKRKTDRVCGLHAARLHQPAGR